MLAQLFSYRLRNYYVLIFVYAVVLERNDANYKLLHHRSGELFRELFFDKLYLLSL